LFDKRGNASADTENSHDEAGQGHLIIFLDNVVRGRSSLDRLWDFDSRVCPHFVQCGDLQFVLDDDCIDFEI